MNKQIISLFFIGLVSTQTPDANGCYTDMQLVEMSEGFQACMYTDTTGNPTICYGYNLNNGNAANDLANVGADYTTVMNGGCLSDSQCTSLLQEYVTIAENAVTNIYGSSVSCYCAQYVLDDMSYNMGSAGLATFTTF